LCLFCGVAGKEKKANLKIVKYLHFPFTGYAEFVSKAKQQPRSGRGRDAGENSCWT
jgi:hypothetical protein